MIEHALDLSYVPASHRSEIRKALQAISVLTFGKILSDAYRIRDVYVTR